MLLLRIIGKLNTIKHKIKLKILYKDRFSYKGLTIRGNFSAFIEDNASIEIGSAFFNRGCSLNAHKRIMIGDNCLFGENVKVYDHNHIYKRKDVPISQQGFTVDDVIIGDNCWIGSDVIILKGVTIGDNVVIGAKCLIYKDIPSNSIVKSNSSLTITERIDIS